MKKKFYLLAILLFTGVITFNACKKDPKDDENPIVLTPLEQAQKDYKELYVGSNIENPGWTGSVTGCVAGSVSQAAQDGFVKRINYFRKLVGLPGNVLLNPAQNKMGQECALIMKAKGQLSHFPPSSWPCYTADGATAAAGSNIALSGGAGPSAMHASNAITAYIHDFGAGNEKVGHRAWILLPELNKVGHGSTDVSNSMIWKDNYGTKPINNPEYIAYPPNGYIPTSLIFERWSFSITGANFSTATVKINGGALATTVIARETSMGKPDSRIVWTVAGIIYPITMPVNYTVTIEDVKNAPKTSYTYVVKAFTPSSPARKDMTLTERAERGEIQIK